MRYLGIDYGTKRVGLALSDESGFMAFPLAVIKNDAKRNDTIVKYVKEKHVEAIVIGHSVDMKGNKNAAQEGVEALMLDLTLATGLPIHLEPEWFTTVAATRFQGKTDLKDASAAALILDSYLVRDK